MNVSRILKIGPLLAVLFVNAALEKVLADSPQVPKGKISFSMRVPREDAERLTQGQQVDVLASGGQKSVHDPAPVLDGAIVLGASVLEVGQQVSRDGSVLLVLAVEPSDDEKIKMAKAQKAALSLDTHSYDR